MKHLSSLELDSLALGALPAGEQAAAGQHLADCARCRTDAAALAESRAHFTAAVLPQTMGAVRRGAGVRQRRVWWAGVLVALGSAAAVLLVVRPHPAEDDLREKGSAGTLQAFVQRGTSADPVPDGATLKPGDAVRLVARANGVNRYLAVLSKDPAGHVTRWFPLQGEISAAIAPGVRVELPGSIVLDASPGPEELHAFFSSQPESLAALEARLSTHAPDFRIRK